MSAEHNHLELLSKLAHQYGEKGRVSPREYWADILKAHTLYNACASRSSAKKWREKAFEVQKMYWGDDVSSTLKEQTEIARGFQAQLYTIRDECKDDTSPVTNVINRWDCTTANLDSAYNKNVTNQLINEMKTISLAGNIRIKVFAGKLIQRSVELCRKPVPCKFVAVALGSMAKGEATPYSDLEFMFLLEKKTPEIAEYFETLAMTVYFLIGNLRETKLKYMNIAELKAFKDKGKNGFKIDGLQAKAGNIPTGNGTEEQKNKFILTVDELLEKYQNILMNPDPVESKKGDFTSMLAHTTVIYGEPGLLTDFERRKHLLEGNEARVIAHSSMIKQDVEDYDFLPLMGLTMSNHRANLKSAIYRFPSLLIYNMKIIYKIESKTSWETLEKLRQMKKLSQSFYFSLQFLLASALYIRMAAYLHHNSQNDDMTFVPSANPSKESHLWHIPRPLYLHMSLHMIPVKHTIAESNGPLDAVTTKIKYDTEVVSAHVNYYAGNHIEALEVLENLPSIGYTELQMLSHCYMSLQQWNKYHPTVHLIIRYIQARAHNYILNFMLPYYKYKSATGYAQAGDFASAKKGFEELLSDLPSHLFYNHEIFAHASNFYLEICDEDKAKHYYEKACAHLEEVAPTMDQAYYDTFRSEILHNRAASLIDSLRYEEAEPLLIENIEVCNRIYGHDGICVGIANSYHALGNVYHGLGQHAKAHEHQQKAEELYKLINPAKRNNFQNISFALAYEAQGNLKKTLEHYLKAQKQIKKDYSHNHPRMADIKRRIGFILTRLQEYENAEKYFKQSLAIYDFLNDCIYDTGLARCHKDFGCLYFLQNQHGQCLYHSYKATSLIYNSDDVENMDTVCEAWWNVGHSLMVQHKFADAAASYEKSINFRNKKSEIPSITHAMNYFWLGQCYRRSSLEKCSSRDRYEACSNAHEAFINAISVLCHDQSPKTDNSDVYLMIASGFFTNWFTWLVAHISEILNGG